jgi:hypothetical protein
MIDIVGGFMGDNVPHRSQRPISPTGMRVEKVGLEFGPLCRTGADLSLAEMDLGLRLPRPERGRMPVLP